MELKSQYNRASETRGIFISDSFGAVVLSGSVSPKASALWGICQRSNDTWLQGKQSELTKKGRLQFATSRTLEVLQQVDQKLNYLTNRQLVVKCAIFIICKDWLCIYKDPFGNQGNMFKLLCLYPPVYTLSFYVY